MGRPFQTLAAMACLKSLLMVFNFILWLSGIIIVVVGIWMEVHLYKYMEMSTAFSNSTPYILIGTGVCIFLIGSFACCCTLKGQPVLLYIYGVILAIVFILEIGCSISLYAYRDELAKGFDSGITQVMENYYKNDTSIANDLDYLQNTQQCCGNHGPSDWLKIFPNEIPKSCCINYNCNTDDDSQIFKQGCYSKIVNFLNSNLGIIAVAAMTVAIFPLLGLILSCCLAYLLNKHNYEQMA